MRLIASVEDAAIIRRILADMARWPAPERPGPGPSDGPFISGPGRRPSLRASPLSRPVGA